MIHKIIIEVILRNAFSDKNALSENFITVVCRVFCFLFFSSSQNLFKGQGACDT